MLQGEKEERDILIKKEIAVRKDFTDSRGTDLMVEFLFKPRNNLTLIWLEILPLIPLSESFFLTVRDCLMRHFGW